MTSTRDLLDQLPPRLRGVGVKLLNHVDHSQWDRAEHAEEAVRVMAEEILRLRAHLGRRELYFLDESAIHPTLPRRSDAQFGHAIHADTCTMCADDVEVFAALRRQADRSEAGRLAYVGGVHDVRDYLKAIEDRAKLGEEVPSSTDLVKTLTKALTKLSDRARAAWAKADK